MITSENKPKTFGILAVIVAFLGLLAVLVGPAIRDAIVPPPPPEQRLAATVVTIKESIVARVKKTAPPQEVSPQRFSREELPYTLSLAFAATAIIGGSVSFLRYEDRRYAYVAWGVSAVTLAWYAVLLALGALVLCFILYYVVPELDLG